MNESEFLNAADLHALTGYARLKQQAAWLRAEGIPHQVRGTFAETPSQCYICSVTSKKDVIGIGVLKNRCDESRSLHRSTCGFVVCASIFGGPDGELARARRFAQAVPGTPTRSGCRHRLASRTAVFREPFAMEVRYGHSTLGLPVARRYARKAQRHGTWPQRCVFRSHRSSGSLVPMSVHRRGSNSVGVRADRTFRKNPSAAGDLGNSVSAARRLTCEGLK